LKVGWEIMPLGAVCQFDPPKAEARRRLAGDQAVSFVPMNDLGISQKEVTASQQKPLGAVVGSYTYFAEDDVLLAKITPCFENGKLGSQEILRMVSDSDQASLWSCGRDRTCFRSSSSTS
jgi:type I restriction enzyme, S subunit